MTLSALVLCLGVLAAADTEAPPAPPPAPPPATPIDAYRMPFDLLSERMIGTAAKPLRFDWRKTRLGVGVVAGQLLELNNFESSKVGGVARFVVGGFLAHVGLNGVWASATPSSDLLARTPYRQAGRPGRLELDLGLSLPIAEGVVTAWPAFFPATEMVLLVTAELRYLFYAGSLHGASASETLKTVLTPHLSAREQGNLEARRLPGMHIDPARYAALVGLTLDIYLHAGFFLSPRVLVAVPVLQGPTGSDLGLWWDVAVGAGYAF